MTGRSDQDAEQRTAAPSARPSRPVTVDRDATYPMLAPAAAVAMASDQDAEDVQPCAGHVNV